MRIVFLSSLLLQLTLGCTQESTPPADDTTEGITEAETSVSKTLPSDKILDRTYYMYHTIKDDSLILQWYGEELFDTQQVEFKGKWRISPEIEGTLQVHGVSELKFVPKEGLTPNQTYTITIEEIPQKDNPELVWMPRESSHWKKSTTTPSFKVRGISFDKIDRQNGTANIILQLSHHIPLKEVNSKTTVLLDGQKVKINKFIQKSPKEILIEVSSPSLMVQTLEVKVDALKYNDTVSSEPYNWTGELGSWRVMHLYGPYLKENATGFTIEYICDDTSVKERSWHYDYDISFDEKISDRCSIDTEQLLNTIQVEPAVDNLRIYPRKHGFALVGDFQHGNYTINIPAGASTQDGGALLETINDPVLVPHRDKLLRFHSTGRYMPVDGWTNIHFQHRNIDEVELTVRSVSKENLHHWAQDDNETVQQQEGRLILKKTISVNNSTDQIMRSSINLKEHLTTREAGIYEVSLETPKSDEKGHLTVQITDMNLISKRYQLDDGSQMVAAWVLHARTNKPLANVDMSIVSPSGKSQSTCSSDASGYCSFTIPKDDLNNNIFALYAEQTGADGNPELAYLVFDTLSIDLGLYNASGTVGSDKTYRLAAHTDRGAYRPGDTVQLFGLVREKDNTAPNAGLPIHLNIKDGRGQIVQQHTINSTAAGVFTHTLKLSGHANTGTWEAEWFVKGGKDEDYLGTQTVSFKVENLVPERLAVQAKFDERDTLGGNPLTGTIKARYLFGKSAEGAEFQVRCDVQSTPFSPRTNGNYTYGSHSAFEDFYLGTVKGTLNENGEGTFTCPDPSRVKGLPGMATVVAAVDVMESGSGRSTKRSSRIKVHPTETYLGLQISAEDNELQDGVNYPVSGIVVDWNGTRQTSVSTIDLQFSEIDYSQNWTFNEDAQRHEVTKKVFEILLHTQSVNVKNGMFSYMVQGNSAVDAYRLRAQAGSSVTVLDLDHAYRYWYARVQTPDPFRPDNLDIQAPAKMDLTETTTVTTIAPYPGKMLWTVESDDIIRQEWVDVEPGEVSWQFSLAGQPFENTVYVTALLVKDAHSDSKVAYMPSRAFGTQPIKVRSKAFNHTLSIDAPSEVQANTPMTIKLDLGGKVEKDTVAMVAVVDEGLLSLTNFQTPDPSDSLFPKMPLTVATAETIGWGISSPSMDSAPAGGGAGEGDARRKAKVVKPVALWSGLVDVGSDGKASHTFEIPQYSGAVRVMAWSASPTKFASADEDVLVRDPLTMQATLPRFLTEGDIFDVPVFLTNLSGKEQKVTISLAANSMIPVGRTEAIAAKTIQFLGADSTTYTIQPDEQKVVIFKAKAIAESGFATFTVTAKNADGSLISKESLEVPFGSRRPTERSFTTLKMSDLLNNKLSGTVDITSHLDDWMIEDSVIWSTNNPYSESLIRVRDLLRYPYGCVEQTSSSLRPLLSAADILKVVDPITVEKTPIDKMVTRGINRLASMQTSDGGLGYWPGAEQSHPWGTAYATHTLLDAKDAGHPVMESLLDGTLDYLDRITDNQMNYGSYSSYQMTTKPYAHYLLARVGRGKPVAIRNLLEETTHNTETEYMLKTALYLSGDRTYEQELRALTAVANLTTSYDSWSFRSRLRSKAMLLALHQEMFGYDTSAGTTLALNLHTSIQAYKNRYISTQEMGWTSYALTQRVLGDSNWKAPTLSQNGKKLSPTEDLKGNRSWSVWDTQRNGNQLSLKGSGSEGYLIIASEGVKTDGAYEYGDHSIEITRTYKNLDNTPFNPETQQLGDEVIVVLTLTNLTYDNLNELAVVDRVPAGWEIQNPNLQDNASTFAGYSAKSSWDSEYLSIQDDRIEIFGDLDGKQSVSIIYMARATTSGNFTIPPVSVESMYDDTIWSRHQGMNVQINGQWDGDQL